MKLFKYCLLISLLAVNTAVRANDQDVKIRGNLAAQWRYFIEDAQYPEQFNDSELSISFKPEFRYQANKNNSFTLIPFARIDDRDPYRSHFDIREAHWLHLADEWELLLGINQVFWGVTESRHLVDIINQTDSVENFDGEDKLGQAMINFSLQRYWGDLDLFILPGFREATYSSDQGRLRLPRPVKKSSTEFAAANEQQHVDMAIRYINTFGNWDVGGYYFRGTGREARFNLNESGTHFIAHYDQIQQLGTDIQYTHDAWLWKFEGILREGQAKTFFAMVGGFEYTFYQLNESHQLNDSSVDVGVLIEYLYDGRDTDIQKAPPNSMQNDLFIGSRISWNDVNNRSMIVGVVIDMDDQSSIFSLEYEQRINNFWSVELQSRWFHDIDKKNTLNVFKQDSYISLNIIRYF